MDEWINKWLLAMDSVEENFTLDEELNKDEF